MVARAKKKTLFLEKLFTKAWFLPVVLYNAILFPFMRFIPVWDGYEYWNCLKQIMNGPFSVGELFCYNHPSGFFMSLYALVQLLEPGNIYLLNGFTFVLGSISIVAVSAILKRIAPTLSDVQHMFLLAIYASQPIIIGNSVHFSADLGVLFFFTYFLWALVNDRRWLMVLIGVAMVFTKESGVLLYALASALYAGGVLFRTPKKKRTVAGWSVLPLLIPIVLFALYYAFLSSMIRVNPVWDTSFSSKAFTDPLSIIGAFDLFSRRFLSTLFAMFVINFLWITTLTVALSMFHVPWKTLLKKTRAKHKAEWYLPFFLLLLFGSVFGLSRYLPFFNVRYFIGIYVLLLILLAMGLSYIRTRSITMIILSVIFFTNIISLFQTVDPLSKYVFGTFSLGDAHFLQMGRTSGDVCCYEGRDQLVYNLQYTAIPKLFEEVYRSAKPFATAWFFDPTELSWNIDNQRIDLQTMERTTDPAGKTVPFLPLESLHNGTVLPQVLYVLEFPVEGNRRYGASLLPGFTMEQTYEVHSGIASITVTKMVKR